MYHLGVMQGGSGFFSSEATGTSGIGPVAIPQNIKRIYLQPNSTGLQFELKGQTGASTTAARGAFLNGPNLLNGPFNIVWGPGTRPVVAVYNSAGGIVQVAVFAAP